MKHTLFLFPNFNPKKDRSGNPYLFLLSEALLKRCTLKNRMTSRFGFLSVFCNFDVDYVVLNWTESIPYKPFGYLQVIAFVVGILLLKFTGKRIIWIAHNKKSHLRESVLSDFCMWMSARCASKVICHASEGISFFYEKYPFIKNLVFVQHPAYSMEMIPTTAIEYDFIIWGGLDRRKRIAEFVKFARSREYYKEKKILICGRAQDPEYEKELRLVCDDFCVLKPGFVSEVQLREFIQKSRCILFTYKEENTLGSGALIYSLNFGKKIIGPKSGAFLDLPECVLCFDSFDDIEDLASQSRNLKSSAQEYVNLHTWDKLTSEILSTGQETEG